jgi:protoheme IX farnesyltransferase
MKITKLEITMLIDMVAIAAFLAVPGGNKYPFLLLILVISGTLASMSASLFNNIYDIDIDIKMKRTRSRSKIVNENTRNRMIFFASIMIVISLVLSYFLLNFLTMIFIFGGFLSYVVLYTIVLKRRTSWNIVIGGIAGSFPALAGWASLTDSVSITSLFIAFLVFMWTPTHFWNLSVNNIDDYKENNIPMLPARVGIKKTAFWIMINTIILITYSLIPFFISYIHVGYLYFPMAVIMDVILLAYVIRPFMRNYDRKYFRSAFGFSNMYMLILLIVIMIPFI